MSRRTHPCRTCDGRTRHDDRSCSICRNDPLIAPRQISIAAYDAAASMRAAGERVRQAADAWPDAVAAWRAQQYYALSISKRTGNAFQILKGIEIA